MFVLVMNKIGILNIINGGSPKVAFFYLVFFEKSGLEWMLISPIFSSFVSYNANQTRETAMSTQFPSFFSFFLFFFSSKALVIIIIIIIIIMNMTKGI